MKHDPDVGFHWRAERDGTILYRVDETSPTLVISRSELQRITQAGEYVAAALFASVAFTFAFNGHWWLSGFRRPEFAALLFFIMVIPALMIAHAAIVRHAILSKAPVSSRQIEIHLVTETVGLAMRYLTRHVGSFWLWLANAALMFGACELIITTIRFIQQPVRQYIGHHQPGPLDGVFYLLFVATLIYLLTSELVRRHRKKRGAQTVRA